MTTSIAGIPESILVLLTSCHSSSNEFLRHFWSAVLPPRPEDISAAAMATPEQRAAKAQRMIGYLQKTDERVKDVVRKASSEGVDVKKVEMVSVVLSRPFSDIHELTKNYLHLRHCDRCRMQSPKPSHTSSRGHRPRPDDQWCTAIQYWYILAIVQMQTRFS